MADPTADATKAAGLFSSLEKATEAQTFLLLFTFMLLVDSGFIHSLGHGIAALARDETLLKPHLGVLVVVIFVVLSLLMSMARPVVGGFIVALTVQVAFALRGLVRGLMEALSSNRQDDSDAMSREYRSNLGHGEVTLVALRRKAHGTMDRYYLDLLREAETRVAASDEQGRQLTLAATSMLVVAGYNWFEFPGPASPGFLRQTADYIGDGGTLVVWLLLIGIYYTFVVVPMFADPLRWTYCPPLAREPADDFDRRKEEQRKFKDELTARRHQHPDHGTIVPPRPLGSDFD